MEYAHQIRRLGCMTPLNQRFVTLNPPQGAEVLPGCRHTRAVPLVFRFSAQFKGLVDMSVPT
jgi:hypothetical protein